MEEEQRLTLINTQNNNKYQTNSNNKDDKNKQIDCQIIHSRQYIMFWKFAVLVGAYAFICVFLLPIINPVLDPPPEFLRYKAIKGTRLQALNFPKQTRNQSLPYNIYDYRRMKSSNISQQSLQLARMALKLGLKQPPQQFLKKQKQYYQKKYQLQKTFKQQLNSFQLPICVVSASFQNVQNDRYKFNINSIMRQQYQNFHFVIVDDASKDQTGKHLLQYIEERKFNKSKIIVIINDKNKGPLQNTYNLVMNHCKPQQIVIVIDGDDGFIGTQTFKLFNHFYQTTDSWFVYANFINSIISQQVGTSVPMLQKYIKYNSYRDVGMWSWVTNHPWSFYGKLFHEMRKDQLFYNDKIKQQVFYKTCADRAYIYPVFELSNKRTFYIPQIVYIYLDLTPYSEYWNHYYLQATDLWDIMQKQKQTPLECLFGKKDSGQCVSSKEYILNENKQI